MPTSPTLLLKVCLADRQPIGKDLKNVKEFLSEKVLEAIDPGSFIPIFKDNKIGRNGVYLSCSDFSTAQWLKKLKEANVAGQNCESIKMTDSHSMVRLVTCVDTRMSSERIVRCMARMNTGINILISNVSQLFSISQIGSLGLVNSPGFWLTFVTSVVMLTTSGSKISSEADPIAAVASDKSRAHRNGKLCAQMLEIIFCWYYFILVWDLSNRIIRAFLAVCIVLGPLPAVQYSYT